MAGLTLEFLDDIKQVLLVSFGAILGSNIRLFIYDRSSKFFIRKDLRIVSINILASFFLGYLAAIYTNKNFIEYSNELSLFFLIGLLGSLSTFSTFIYDLFELSSEFKICGIIRSLVCSIFLSLILFWIGYLLANL